MRMFAAALLALFSVSALADTYVQGYYKKDGTYVAPHFRSSPNSSRYDNYGSRSPQQKQQTYGGNDYGLQRDQDNDGVANRYDYDDDNDGILDQYDNN